MAAAAAAGLAAAALYGPVAAGLGRQWVEDPSASYGALVLVAAGVAFRQRWALLRSLPLDPSWTGAVALSAACAVCVVATLAADVYLMRASGVAFAAASVWYVRGGAHVRALAAPFGLCLAAIPLPSAVVTELTLPLQLAASNTAAASLGAMGLDVARDGNVLTLSYITLEVADACSGLRSLFTLLALVAVYAATGGPPLRRVLALVIAAVPITILGNAMRVIVTALLAARMGEGATRGAVHDATGFAAFIFMCAALAGTQVIAARAPARHAAAV